MYKLLSTVHNLLWTLAIIQCTNDTYEMSFILIEHSISLVIVNCVSSEVGDMTIVSYLLKQF